MSGDHNMYQKSKSYLDDFECPRFGHCCQALVDETAKRKHIKTWHERCEEHPDHQQGMISERMIQERMQEEIDELRQALETEQEPVAWANSLDFDDDDIEIIPARAKGKLGTSNCDIPLYTAPQKKQWVGLTEKEWHEATGIPRNATLPMSMLKGIEKALKEKNHG